MSRKNELARTEWRELHRVYSSVPRILRVLHVCNTSSSDRQIWLGLTNALLEREVTLQNQVISGQTILANETYTFQFGFPLSENDIVWFKASSDFEVSFHLFYE